MTSEYATESNVENKLTQHPEQSVSASSEVAYEQLTSYGFARRYVREKVVANISLEEVGYGSRLLAETAESVTALTSSAEAVDLASTAYSAPKVSYQRVDLPKQMLSEGHFDVVVALGVIESLVHPEDLVREVKRGLKKDGVLVISALDKQTNANERNRRGVDGRQEMYVLEFRDLLEHHFGHVHIYRQGAVSGGFVFPASEAVTGAPVETARFSLTNPDFGVEPPTTRSVIAVCSDAAEALGQGEQPYLLLDRDRRVFEECEERAEDVELMRGEIQRMQETEVQAFVDAIKVRQSLAQELLPHLRKELLPHLRNLSRDQAVHLRNVIRADVVNLRNLILADVIHLRNLLLEDIIHGRNIIHGNIQAIRRKGVRGVVRGGFRRSSALYRRLRTRNKSSD
jgi:SAM-dependent methyltransferase